MNALMEAMESLENIKYKNIDISNSVVINASITEKELADAVSKNKNQKNLSAKDQENIGGKSPISEKITAESLKNIPKFESNKD